VLDHDALRLFARQRAEVEDVLVAVRTVSYPLVADHLVPVRTTRRGNPDVREYGQLRAGLRILEQARRLVAFLRDFGDFCVERGMTRTQRVEVVAIAHARCKRTPAPADLEEAGER